MSDAIKHLAEELGLFLCVQCGKCVAVCPMGEIFADYAYEVAPRGIIERVLLDFRLPEDHRLWLCLTCDLCTSICPMGVRFRDFVEAARQVVISSGTTEHGVFCRDCGKYLWPRHTVEYLKQTLGDDLEASAALCIDCRRHDFAHKVKAQTPGSRQVPARDRRKGKKL